MRLFLAEGRKLSHDTFIYICIAVLCFLNVIFLWADSGSGTAIPPAAYRKMTTELHGLSMEEKGRTISQAYELAYDMYRIDYLLQYLQGMDNQTRINAIKEEITQLDEKHPDVYAQKSYLKYTDNLTSELTFLAQIQREYEAVNEYDAFLAGVQNNAIQLSNISIFATAEDDYEMFVVNATADTYAKLNQININYLPQKGIITITNFQMTDILFLLGMLFMAIAVVREERDSGLLPLIRSAPYGRLRTAVAKLCIYAAGLFVVVIALYGTNVIYCWVQYGLGDLSRSMQSVPELMRSTLQIRVCDYLVLYFFTKWLGAFSIGVLMLVTVLVPNRPYTGYFLGFFCAVALFCIRLFISPTSRINFFKYANAISLLNTNELLGDYRLLYFFGVPIPMFAAEALYALVTTSLFCFIFSFLFAKAELHNKKSTANFRARRIVIFKKFNYTTAVRIEWYKMLVLNGAALVLLGFVGFQVYTALQQPHHMGAEEMYYRYYAKQIEGTFTRDKYDWLEAEHEKFMPMLRLQYDYSHGRIDEDAYSDQMSLYYSLQMEYGAFLKVLGQLEYVRAESSLQFIYETGYLKLFAPYTNNNLMRCIIFLIVGILIFSGAIPIEYTSGMIKLLHVTPNGHQKTIRAKIINSIILAVLISLAYQAPSYIQVARDYGLGVLGAPAKSISAFAGMPDWISLLGWMIISELFMVIGFICVCLIVLAISVKVKTQLATIFLSAIIWVVPILFTLMGSTITKWFSLDVVFGTAGHAIAPEQVFHSMALLLMLILAAILCGYYTTEHFNSIELKRG